MSKISKLFILQFLLTPLYTQKLKIQDMQTKEPLTGVNVFSSTYGTTTDTNGVCSLEKFTEKDEIVFSHIGYKMIKATKHNLSDNLYLTIASIPMDRVSVLSFKSTEEKKKFKKIKLPKFDKSIDDRLNEKYWFNVKERPEIVIFEGWCVGAKPQLNSLLKKPINILEKYEDKDLIWRKHANHKLKKEYKKLFAMIDYFIFSLDLLFCNSPFL